MSATQTIGGLGASLMTSYLATTTQPVFGMDPSIALAGFIGSAISILMQKSLATRETLLIAVCGTACSVYGTSLVARWMGVEGDALGTIGLLLGVLGIYIFRRISDIAQDPQHIIDAIRSGKWFDLLKTQPRVEPPVVPPTL
jgi:uncharacterized membrane protein YfcA